MTKVPGFSLIELILAFGILAMLAVTTTVILSSTLRSSARSSVSAKVRNEGEYLMESIFQMVRYSRGVTCTTSVAGFPELNMAKKNPNDNFAPKFTCLVDEDYIASNSALLNLPERISSTEVAISGCTFICSPTQVNVRFSVQDVDGIIADPLIFDTTINLRNTQ